MQNTMTFGERSRSQGHQTYNWVSFVEFLGNRLTDFGQLLTVAKSTARDAQK